MKQLKVGLTDNIRDELDRAAKARGVSTSEEARIRLEWSLERDYYDVAALELSDHLLGLADSISRFENTGTRPVPRWHKKPALFEALKVAIETWLSLVAPSSIEGQSSDVDPLTLGRSTAVSQYRYLIEKLKVDREMKEMRESLLDEPAFHYSGSYGSGTMTVRDIDNANSKMSDKEKLMIREEAEKQLSADLRKEFPRRKPSKEKP